jgi:hypothetical protein
METWDIWYPDAAATGLPFCRARIEHADEVLLHAAPESLRVEVRDEEGRRLASGDGLRRAGASFPMTRLRRDGERIVRSDGWPAAEGDRGRIVLLPGGEAGMLTSWWNAEDGSEWRWSVEFYNRKR